MPETGRDLGLVAEYRAPREKTARPPLLIVIHGRGANEFDLLPLAEYLDQRLAIVAPRAPLPRGPGFAWYELTRIGSPEAAGFQASLRALREFVEASVARFAEADSPVFLLGFSQGAVMSGALVLGEPRRFAGAVLLSGYLPLETDLTIARDELRGFPVFVGHGTGDPLIPVDYGRLSEQFWREAGADLTYQEYPIGHQISEAELTAVAAWLAERLDGVALGVSAEEGSE